MAACFGLGLLRAELAIHRVAEDSILRHVGSERRLVRVRGTVAGEPRSFAPDAGDFAAFNPRLPGVRFELEVDQADAGSGFEPAGGLLALAQATASAPAHAGDRIEALGWLFALHAPRNPGEFDMAAHQRRKGVCAHLAAGNVRVLAPASAGSWPRLRADAAARAQTSLAQGLHRDKPARTTLISALLLGAQGGEGSAELWRDFQRAGLAHVLAISGANVGVFLLGVWWLGRLVSGRPARVALAVLAVVALFLLAVPDETPVLRAGVMALVLAAAYGLGRPVLGLWALGASALVLLLWRPMELFSPGFQLSFAAVGALFLFVRPIADRVEIWMTGRLPIENEERLTAARKAGRGVLRLCVEAAVASGVVFLAVLPILMFHFDAFIPLAAVFSLAGAPLAALLMWVGYVKIALGLVWLPLGGLLAWPVEWCADALAAVVHLAAHVPGAQVALVQPASLGATCAVLAGIWAALGWFGQAGRNGTAGDAPGLLRRLGTSPAVPWLLLVLSLSGLAAEQVYSWHVLRSPPGLRLHALAVGDGSAFVLETSERALLFDCGSRTLPHPGERIVVPALRRLGVRRLDALIVSHADLDHFGGMLEVADALPVRAAYLGPSVWAESADPRSTSAVLLAGLRARGIPCFPILRGWRMDLGPGAYAEALWPTAQTAPTDSRNDQSVVLRACQGGRRILLSADLEAAGMRNLFRVEKDLEAEVADLPHHGGFTDESPQWWNRVSPRTVIQSSSPERLESENSQRWAPLLEQAQVKRQTTGQSGWVRVELKP